MLYPHAEIYLHFVWATFNREALITPAVETQLYAVIAKKCEAFKCVVLAIGGMPDHVHLLLRVPASVAPADLIQEVKGGSSHAMNHQIAPAHHFRWQGAYGVFSVSVNFRIAGSARLCSPSATVHRPRSPAVRSWVAISLRRGMTSCCSATTRLSCGVGTQQSCNVWRACA